MDEERSKQDLVSFTIQVKDPAATERIVADLVANGLSIDRVLKTVGVVGGHGPSHLKRALSAVRGVGIVREEQHVALPPFDENVPQ